MDENKIQIIFEYNNGVSMAKLAKHYNVSQWSIKNLLDKNNIKTRTFEDTKIKFNKDFFFAQTPETYYFWGFMLGDGCLITHKQGHKYITISLKDTDKSVLLQFCKWLNIDPIHIKTRTNNYKTTYVRLEVYGNFFKENDFSKFGLVSNKTYNPSKLEIPEKYIKPFILGFIDADGGIYENTLSLVGHPFNMDWIIDQLRKIGFNGNINHQIIKGKWKRIRIQRKEDVLNLAKLLYLDKYYNLCLARKWSDLYFEITK